MSGGFSLRDGGNEFEVGQESNWCDLNQNRFVSMSNCRRAGDAQPLTWCTWAGTVAENNSVCRLTFRRSGRHSRILVNSLRKPCSSNLFVGQPGDQLSIHVNWHMGRINTNLSASSRITILTLANLAFTFEFSKWSIIRPGVPTKISQRSLFNRLVSVFIFVPPTTEAVLKVVPANNCLASSSIWMANSYCAWKY